MKSFTIHPSSNSVFDENTNETRRVYFLNREIQAFHHSDYTKFGAEGNPDCINHLKNQFGNTSTEVLKKGIENLKKILEEDLPKIRNICNTDFIVCVIPRAKAEGEYSDDQKLFKTVISNVVNKLSGYSNGTTYIIRHTNTRTTHMNRSGYGGDGKMPYPGITKDTCSISNDVIGKDILLIDDLYTKTINIDEDAIQALLDKGAKSVVFYSIGKTVSKY
ncbi:phosphoribosyltransferase [Apibacter muscae]|uniref:phosphoribosyltransferase n=1 Tax=Apibacter muscae TaxID=2509004 RepID=UPI001C8880EE|nr:phosphoribosyltransferase [Apibacter muscae]